MQVPADRIIKIIYSGNIRLLIVNFMILKSKAASIRFCFAGWQNSADSLAIAISITQVFPDNYHREISK